MTWSDRFVTARVLSVLALIVEAARVAEQMRESNMADDEVVGRVISGASWAQFCEALKAAGAEVLRPETPATELDRAEGWRYLTRLTRVGA